MTEKEIILYILDWIRYRHKDILEQLLDDVPAAAILLAGRSQAASKLERMEKSDADDS
jgi:hypothetical protein